MALQLPIIDISVWREQNSPFVLTDEHVFVAKKWDEAMRKFGFAVIVGHNIQEQVFTGLLKEMKTFFEQSIPDKMKFNHGRYGHPDGGFSPAGYETVGLSMEEKSELKFDPVENFVFTSSPSEFINPTGQDHSPFPSSDSYYSQMNDLLASLHRLSAAALQLNDIEFFQRYYDNSYWPNDMGKNGNCLRLAHYPGRDAINNNPGRSRNVYS